MKKLAKLKYYRVSEIIPTLRVEIKKVQRSKAFWISILSFSFFALIAGLFVFILKNPELANRLGLIGDKAEIFGGTADWPGLFDLVLLMASIGSLIIFGFIFVWIFGREHSDKTIYDLLALPTSRTTIVSAKLITASGWSIALILLVYNRYRSSIKLTPMVKHNYAEWIIAFACCWYTYNTIEHTICLGSKHYP